MIQRHINLRTITLALIIGAALTGIGTTWHWMQSNHLWRSHKDAAFDAGITAYYALQNGTAPSAGVKLTPLSKTDAGFAAAGAYRKITNAPPRARITIVPILPDPENPRTGRSLSLAILSPDLIYRLAPLPHHQGQSAAETTGEVFRLLASYCSEPFVVAQMGDGPWVQIDGSSVWACDIAPADRRLPAAVAAIIAIGIMVTLALNLPADFHHFAEKLRNRRRVGGPRAYSPTGPAELQDIVAAVNEFLAAEREQLEQRAAVLSGVSHDLGTPATRLRLRAALIKDADLRKKLESDIDSMTGMIDSVLTYTRAEMSIEDPVKMSLTAFVESVVANYQDIGRAVTYRQRQDMIVDGARSVFMSKQGKGVVAGDRQITIMGRPIALERALENLIDNALKYGRRATVALETDLETATIIVEDEGSNTSAENIKALMAPFKRGDNTTAVDGYGLGLTIVSTIATLHGGAVSFENTTAGLAVRLTIQRA